MGSTIKWVSERIGALSGGSIKTEVYEPNKLPLKVRYIAQLVRACMDD